MNSKVESTNSNVSSLICTTRRFLWGPPGAWVWLFISFSSVPRKMKRQSDEDGLFKHILSFNSEMFSLVNYFTEQKCHVRL